MNAIVRAVDVTDTTQSYTVEIQRNNGTVLTTAVLDLPIQLEPADATAQIKRWANDLGETFKPKNQRKLLQVGTVIDLG